MYIILYEHKYGTDSWVRKNLEHAMLSIADTMLDYLCELREKRHKSKLLNLLKTEQWSAAINLWRLETDEDFRVEELPDEFHEESKEDTMCYIEEALKNLEEEEVDG